MLVKAAFGGGGRGMRVVHAPDELAEAVASAEREAASAFGDGTVFLERFVVDPRHIEVQIFGDTHGNVIHLFERECSIQRRYQKIIEEAPSPAVDATRRDALGNAAVAAAKALGYVGAGTVEFVMDQQGEFFFLEVNTRLQVEHPVTEMITGLDLVRMQLLVAQGEPLPDDAVVATINGHSIEARLYAEDVAAGFLPASGPVDRLRVTLTDGVRVDAGFEDGSVVSTFYDAMLAKVIAWGPTRTDAARRLAEALATRAGARRHHQPRSPRAGAAASRVPRRPHRHRVPATARSGRAQCAVGRRVGPAAARGGGRARGPGRAPGVGARARPPAVGLAQRAVRARAPRSSRTPTAW